MLKIASTREIHFKSYLIDVRETKLVKNWRHSVENDNLECLCNDRGESNTTDNSE